MYYDQNDTTAPIFKGAPRPATIWGIPTKAAAFVTFIFLLLFTVTAKIAFMLAIPVALFIMKQIAKTDDQIFHQIALFCLTNIRSLRNRGLHNGLTYFSPVAEKRRK